MSSQSSPKLYMHPGVGAQWWWVGEDSREDWDSGKCLVVLGGMSGRGRGAQGGLALLPSKN